MGVVTICQYDGELHYRLIRGWLEPRSAFHVPHGIPDVCLCPSSEILGRKYGQLDVIQNQVQTGWGAVRMHRRATTASAWTCPDF